MAWKRLGNITRNMAWKKVKAKSGDTLSSIAKSVKPAQTVTYLKKWNGLSSSTIKAGQTIKVYPYYIVQYGDTLGDVAKSFDTTVAKLAKVNPQIKNVNKIYPGDKVRLLEGMEPEEKPPAKKTTTKKTVKTVKKETSKKKPSKTNQSGIFKGDDTVPAHRKLAGDFFLRIGDCQFVIPPSFIRVYRQGNINSRGMIRQKDSLKFKNGQSDTQIDIQLWFTNLEQINGVKVESPISNQKYFMDGLRPLLAQFKRMPFLPIVNEFLNDTMDIHAVALTNIGWSTVEGFPDVIQATISLVEMDVQPYINKPSWTYDHHFMYPVFRWYYNQMLVENKPTISTTYFRPVYEADFTDKFKFKILNEGFLYETKQENKLKSIELDKMAFDTIDLPSNMHCTSIYGSLGTMLAPLKMDFREKPTFQYMGSSDTVFNVRFETTSRDSIAVLEKLFSTMERYSRLFRDKIVTGFMRIENSLINMSGVYNVMMQDLTVSTVEGFPDLFQVDVTFISYRDTQYQDQRIYGQNMVDTTAASELAAGNVGPAKKYLYSKKQPWFLVEEGVAEGMLDNMELYPDLELPTYTQLNAALKKIAAFRKKKGHSALPVSTYHPKYHTFRNYGKEVYSYRKLTNASFVEPDFYFCYPEWNNIPNVDTDTIDQDALSTGGLVEAYTKKNSKGKTNSATTYGKKKTTSNKNRDAIWAFFKAQGFSDAATAGIMGNIQAESSFNPKEHLKDSGLGAYGLFQWRGNRQTALRNFAKSKGTSAANLNTQLEFVMKEIKGSEKNAVKSYFSSGWAGFKKTTDITKATKAWDSGFERSGGSTIDRRIKYAKEIYNIYKGTSGNGMSGSMDYESITANKYLLENAEADVLVPIPKSSTEESSIQSESNNPNALMRSMMHDMQKYSKRGSMIRAFPTFVLAFVDEGAFVDYRRTWNNYYLYHAIEEINLVKERSQPVDTLHISLINIYGALNSTNRTQTKAATKDVRFPGWNLTNVANGSAIKWYWHQWFPTISDDLVKRRMEASQVQGFNLRPGARVHLRMGYGSVASMMPIVFNGRITEMDTSDTVQIVCQSDALELINPYYEWGGDARTTWWNLRQEPKNIIDNLLVDRKGVDWLANFEGGIFGAWKDGGTQSKFGIEHFGYVIGKNTDQWDIWDTFGTAWKAVTGQETVNGYDARKNIYTSNGVGKFGETEGKGPDETNVHFWMSNKSPWDIIQLLTAVAPDYEAKVHEHGFHSTLFYGQPQWYVKYAYRNVSGNPEDMKGYKEVLKVSQQYHHIDSVQDIITNGVKASGSDICTVAVPIYSWDEKPKAASTLFADPNIKPELQKTEMIDIGLLQDFPMLDFVAEVARWAGHSITQTVHDIGDALVDLPLGSTVDSFGNMLKKIKVISKHSRTEKLAIQGAKSHMQWKFREMYKGDIIIIGDSAIRPGDMLNISDIYTQMFGQCEVGRVVHMMSLNEGFVTSVKPDLLAVRKDGERAKMLPAWSAMGTYFAENAIFFMMKSYIGRKKGMAVLSYTKAAKFIRSLKSVRNAAATGGLAASVATAGPFALGALIYELALWAISEAIINAIEDAIYQQRAGISLMPLWYKNRPYVAGIDGHRELIPGYWDENYYGSAENWEPSDGSSDSGYTAGGTYANIKSAKIPEGYNWCYPTVSKRITDTFNSPRSNTKTGNHGATDFGAVTAGKAGDGVYAAATGKVVMSERRTDGSATASLGNYIILEHGSYFTLYAHLSKRYVKKGQTVPMGGRIGLMGNTGSSSAVHLHFEVRPKKNKNYWSNTPVDPVPFLKARKTYRIKKEVK